MAAPADLLGDLSSFIPFSTFTTVQQRVIPSVLHREENIVVAAPTGSGKTLIFEVAILKLFQNILLPQKLSCNKTSSDPGGYPPPFGPSVSSWIPHQKRAVGKAVYVCPIKALANEKYESWTALFPTLSVVIETGDHEQYLFNQNDFTKRCNSKNLGNTSSDLSTVDQSMETAIASADIILTTPERWDSITRRWKEKTVFDVVNSVSLVLLDEIHTVHEERGAALEAMVSRMKAIQAGRQLQKGLHGNGSESSSQEQSFLRFSTRFIAISGTLPNVADFAAWLGVPDDMIFSFSNEDRPVPLTIRICAFQNYGYSNPFAFDRFLSFKLFPLVREHGGGKPCIVFCSTRNQAVSSALQVMQDAREAASREGPEVLGRFGSPSPEVKQLAGQINDKQLRNCALVGIAFHHAALSWSDRKIVESMFRKQYIAVVCTTTTLSLGVNLPAHLVIVKGTTFYNRGNSLDIPVSEVAQMCGRAGRPGLDNHGLALILTTTTKQHLYDNLVRGEAHSLTCVESQLHRHIIEHVNAEIALGTIHTFSSAITWGKTTFFWLRLSQNPNFYGLNFSTSADQKMFNPEKYLELLIKKVLSLLSEEKCISVIECNENEVHFPNDFHPLHETMIDSTPIGRCMSRLYISFGTVAHFNKVLEEKKPRGGVFPFDSSRPVFSLADALQLLSQSEELGELHLRQGDKCHLNLLNKTVKFPLSNGYKGGREVREDWHKVNILIQAFIMDHHFPDMSLRNDMLRLLSSLPRVSRFLKEYGALSQSFSLAVTAEKLKVCVDRKMWEDELVLKQLYGVTEEAAELLSNAGIRSFEDVRRHAAEPHKLEAICSRAPPFGCTVVKLVVSIPIVQIAVTPPQDSSGLFTVKLDVANKADFRDEEEKEKYVAHGGRQPPFPSSLQSKSLFPDRRCPFQLLVGDHRTDIVLLSRLVTISLLSRSQHFEFTFSSPPKTRCFSIYLICERLVGADQHIELQCDSSVGNKNAGKPTLLSPHSQISAIQKNTVKSTLTEKCKFVEKRKKIRVARTRVSVPVEQMEQEETTRNDRVQEENPEIPLKEKVVHRESIPSLVEDVDAATPFAARGTEEDAASLKNSVSSSPVLQYPFPNSVITPALQDELYSKGSNDVVLPEKKIDLSPLQDEILIKKNSTQHEPCADTPSDDNDVAQPFPPGRPLSPRGSTRESNSVFSSSLRLDHTSELMSPEKPYRSDETEGNGRSMRRPCFSSFLSSPPASEPSYSPIQKDGLAPPSSSILNLCARDDRLFHTTYGKYSYLPPSAPQMLLSHKRKSITRDPELFSHYMESSSLPVFYPSTSHMASVPSSGHHIRSSQNEGFPFIQHAEDFQYSCNPLYTSLGYSQHLVPPPQSRIMNSLNLRNPWCNFPASSCSNEPYGLAPPSPSKNCVEDEGFDNCKGNFPEFCETVFPHQLFRGEENVYSIPVSGVTHQPTGSFSSLRGRCVFMENMRGAPCYKRARGSTSKRRRLEGNANNAPVGWYRRETQWW